jgi:hypothetical protein
MCMECQSMSVDTPIATKVTSNDNFQPNESLLFVKEVQ